MANLNVDMDQALRLLLDLLPIPGKSCEEGQIAAAICEKLRAAGVPASAISHDDAHRRTPSPGQVGNLIVKLPGTVRGPRRMLSAHLDTVPICVGCQPVRKGDHIVSANPETGLGGDNRAGCAVLLHAALQILARQLPHPPLTFCWFVQEEIGLHGSRNLRKNALGNPKLAFNWDGGAASKLTVGATGGYRMQIDVKGIASHAGVAPERGVSAIAIASLAIADLHRGGWLGDVVQGKQRGTSNVGFIQGGEATNVVTDRVTLKAEARSHHPPFRARIIREIERSFQRAAKEVRNAAGQHGSVEITGRLDYEAFRLANDSPSVVAAEQAIRQEGGEPFSAVTNGGVDANWLFSHGIPAVTLGCGQINPHMTSEALDIGQFELACRIGLTLATASEA